MIVRTFGLCLFAEAMRVLVGSVSVVCVLAWAPSVRATPAEILIIRHAEKNSDGVDLSDRGHERATALVDFFEQQRQVTRFGTPVAIYAGAPTHEDGSQRAIETVAPLAESLGLELRTGFHKKEVGALVNEVLSNHLYDGKMVLICWEHGLIPDIANAIGAGSVPAKWKGSDFDRVWRIDFDGDQPGDVEDLPQHLLPGDSKY